MIIKDLEYLENMEFESSNACGGLFAFAFRIINENGVIEFAGSTTDSLSEFDLSVLGVGEGSAIALPLDVPSIVPLLEAPTTTENA